MRGREDTIQYKRADITNTSRCIPEMEMDFLGINAKAKLESLSPPRDDARGPTPTIATYGNVASQWQFSNEEPQHFLSFATPREGQPSRISPSVFQPVTSPQKVLGLDANQLHRSQSTPQYLTEARVPHLNQGPSGSASTSLSPRTGPFVGLYQARREFPKQLHSQLTIFYGGSVSVFDNIALDKVKEIMSVANKASSIQRTCTPDPIFEQPSKVLSKSASFSGGIVTSSKPKPTQKLDHVFEPVMLPPSVSTQISLAPQGSAGSSTMSVVTTDNLTMVPPSETPVTKVPMVSNAAPNRFPGIPQSRKASLARFLEKRKERVITSMPYPHPSAAKLTDVLPSKSSSTDLTLSSNNDESTLAGPPRLSKFAEDHAITTLEI